MSDFKYNPNTYVGDLSPAAVKEAMKHARECFPLHSCGAITADGFIPFENAADPEDKNGKTPDVYFSIEDQQWYDLYAEGKVIALVHSHDDFNKASLLDQEQQVELDIPSLIINLRNRSVIDCILFGTKIPAPLYGRPFFYGAFDCLTLTHDYLFVTHCISIPVPAHDWDFWNRDEHPIEDMIIENKELPFYEISNKANTQEGDILLYNLYGTKYLNHMAVVSDNHGQVLHHFYGRVSGNYPITFNKRYHKRTFRRIE